MEKDLLFYNEYEQFYLMAKKSKAFRLFCEKAFGMDFSQDGFSDISQTDRILQYIPKNEKAYILDIGCGNGKMLGYLQEKTNCFIHGFDYSKNAIETAKELFSIDSEFIQGCIGEVDYSEEMFDVIISMDTMYFAPDMSDFVDQIMKWLKKDGVFFVCYQEGDVMPKTENVNTTVFAKTLLDKKIDFDSIDITRETYDMLLHKRVIANLFEKEFAEEGNIDWFNMLIGQTEYANRPYEEFAKVMSRYIYIVRKERRC